MAICLHGCRESSARSKSGDRSCSLMRMQEVRADLLWSDAVELPILSAILLQLAEDL